MRVIHLVAGLAPGGLERVAVDLAVELRGKHPMEFVCFDELGALTGDLEAVGIPFTLVPRRPRFDVGFVRRLHAVLRDRAPSIVHAHNTTAAFYAALAAPRRAGCRVVHTEHGPPPQLSWRARSALRVVGRRIDAGSLVAEVLRSPLRSALGSAADTFVTIPNACARPDPGFVARREDTRAEFGAGRSDRVLLTVSRLVPGKRVADAVDVAEALVREGRSVRLWIAGDGPERPDLAGMVRERGLDDVVRLLGVRADLRRLMAAADFVLHPSGYEACSRVLVEAMAAGLPIVARAVGGNADLLGDGRCGVLVDGDDEMLAAVRSLLDDPERARALGEQGHQRFTAEFSSEVVLPRYLELYRTAAGV